MSDSKNAIWMTSKIDEYCIGNLEHRIYYDFQMLVLDDVNHGEIIENTFHHLCHSKHLFAQSFAKYTVKIVLINAK